MQISGGTITISGGQILFESPTPAINYNNGDPTNLSLGVIQQWTSNTYMHVGLGVQSLQGNDWQMDTLYAPYQLFYAHQAIRLPVGSNRWGVIARQSGTNASDLWGAVSSIENARTNFSSNVELVIGDNVGTINYSANTLYESAITTAFVVPAKRYFLLAVVGGPFYRNYRKSANNFTIVSNGNAIVTAVNEFYWPGWLTNPVQRGIPSQLGGNTSGYIRTTGNLTVASYKFEVM